MQNLTKQRAPIFLKSIGTLAVCIVLSLVYVQKGDKERSAFRNISGKIISKDNSNERYSGKDTSKFRYILIDNFPKPFEIFIGKSTGDFKPSFEQVDLLKVGDSLTVFFDETTKSKNAPVNRLAYFIDRGSEVIFIKGNSIKSLIYGLIIFCALFMIVLVILKKKGKIF